MLTLLIMSVCVLCNGLLSGYEVAFVTASRPEIRRLAARGDKRAQRLLKMRLAPERTLSLVQIGITLLGAISAAAGGAAAGEEIAPHFQEVFHLSRAWAHVLAITLVVVPLTFFMVIGGELVPKAWALRAPLRVALAGSRWAALGDRLLYPAVTVLEWTTKRILHALFPSLPSYSHPKPATALDIGRLPPEHRQYVLNLVNIEHRAISEVMLPWDRVTSVQFNAEPTELRRTIMESGHTRLPVCEEERVVGVLHAKEFLAYLEGGAKDWHTIIRPPLRIDDDDSLLATLQRMQTNRYHMSFVYADDGTLLGILTIEDILEEIVGDIYDEDDDDFVRKLLASRAELKSRR